MYHTHMVSKEKKFLVPKKKKKAKNTKNMTADVLLIENRFTVCFKYISLY